MRNINLLITLLIAITLQSCFKDDGDPLPTSGENSFTAKLNGSQFIAEDRVKFTSTYYGITGYVKDNSWQLRFSNSSNQYIYVYLYKVNEEGLYEIGVSDGNISYYQDSDNETSVSIANGSAKVEYLTDSPNLNEKIKITKVLDDTILIGEFEKITLTDPNNPTEKAILTQGKFNINLSTLNKREDL